MITVNVYMPIALLQAGLLLVMIIALKSIIETIL